MGHRGGGRDVLRDAVLEWAKQFAGTSVAIAEGNTPGQTIWEITIEPRLKRCSKAWVVLTDHTQVYLGRDIRIDRLPEDPEVVLKFLDAAAMGRIEERLWIKNDEVIMSEAEVKLADRTWEVSNGGLAIRGRRRPPDEIIQ